MFANGPGDQGSIPGRVIPKTFKKWYLIPTCLTLRIIIYVSKVKWSNPRKGVAPSPTPQYSSYWKGSLQVTLNYRRIFTFTILTPIFASRSPSLFFLSSSLQLIVYSLVSVIMFVSKPTFMQQKFADDVGIVSTYSAHYYSTFSRFSPASNLR